MFYVRTRAAGQDHWWYPAQRSVHPGTQLGPATARHVGYWGSLCVLSGCLLRPCASMHVPRNRFVGRPPGKEGPFERFCRPLCELRSWGKGSYLFRVRARSVCMGL
eukprot:Rmarinus@m.13967